MKSMTYLLAALAATSLFAASTPPAAAQESRQAKLRTMPGQVYFTPTNPKDGIAASIFFLVLEEPADLDSSVKHLDITVRKGDTVLRTERLAPLLLQAMSLPTPPRPKVAAGANAPMHPVQAYRIAVTLPTNAGADIIEARLALETAGQARTVVLELPVAPYKQKTALVFPFKGPAIISQAGALSGGHRNRSGLYAVDALGLTPTYGPMRLPEPDEDPKNYAGWGREIIAPAAGRIAFARNDRPDQPVAGHEDPAYFSPQYAQGGDPGNHVIIDHGNGEFSMIAHMQEGSLRVKEGDQVAQGQLLGRLGNSGASSGPHVHYQLQAGPDWEKADALPFTFANVSSLEKGTYFNPK